MRRRVTNLIAGGESVTWLTKACDREHCKKSSVTPECPSLRSFPGALGIAAMTQALYNVAAIKVLI
jgi:hypothetical protein